MQGPESRINFPPHFAKLLAPSKHLQGHAGCVNRLAWNENGTMLASGSDDRKVMLWNYPDVDRPPTCIDTRHELNIFGVEFLPCTGSSMVISAAYDRMVQLHRLDRTSVPTAGPYRPPNGGSAPIATQSVQCHTQVFTNHSESVKDVAVEKGNPNCFWSASVDGRVHQFDLRAPNLTEPDAPNMLIQAPQFGGNGGYRLEFNSLDINNVRPWLMATACSDHLVRVYDRRKLSLRDPAASAASVSLLDLCPLHLHLPGQNADRVYTTCARFSHRGDRLVTTYHSEHAYTFDVQGSSRPPEMSFCATRPNLSALEAAARNNDAGGMTGPPGAPNATPLDERASDMRSEANQAVMQDRWDEALKLYNQLILRVPWLAHSWAARAIVLLHRGWKGDYVWALRDADTCVALNPRWHKAYETRVRCLKVLGQIRTAMTELNLLLEEFPDEAGSRTIQALREQLEKELAAQESKRLSSLQKHADPAAGIATNGQPSDPRVKATAEASTAYLKSLQPDSEPADLPNNATEPSRAPLGPDSFHMHHRTSCSHGHEHRHFQAHRNGHASASPPTYDPGHSTAAAQAAVYGEVGNSNGAEAADAPHADGAPQAPCHGGMVWNNLHAEQLGYDPHPPPADDGASDGPSGTVRWVRNAIQRSWGAWLAGESSPGAWEMCREQAATPADAVFLDALRGHKNLGDKGVCMPPGGGADACMAGASASVMSVAGSSGEDLGAAPLGVLSAAGLHSNAAMESRNNSRYHMASHEVLEWASADRIGEAGAHAGTLNGSRGDAAAAAAACSPSRSAYGGNQNCLDCPSDLGSPAHAGWERTTTADEDHEGYASLAGEADSTLRRLGAVVHDDDHVGGDDEDDEGSEDDFESEDDSYNTHMYDWGSMRRRGGRRRPAQQAAGPELMSYIYGHRSWNVPSHERFQPPSGCGHIDSISSLEAAAAYSMRTLQRFVGQCNVVTHIKEATFVGPDDHIVACGSDRGNVFLFDSITGELLRVLAADEEVANCVQCHPTLPVLATSGLEYVVKLWEVQEADEANLVGSAEASMDQLVRENQQRLNSVQIHLSSDAELESIVQNSEILRLTRVRFGDGRQMTCRQS